MNRFEEIEFCKRRIKEQNKYIAKTVNRKITFGKRRDLITGSILIRNGFRKRLCEIIGLSNYVYFIMYEE